MTRKILKRFLFCITLLLAYSQADAMQAMQDVFYAPVVGQKTTPQVTEQQLISNIRSEEDLTDKGTITALVVRPLENERRIVTTLKLTRLSAEGDKNSANSRNNKEFVAVTLMRSDVAEVMGGLHLIGDTIAVSGLNIGQHALRPGDLLVIRNQREQVKAILLKTFVPHYAGKRFEWRFGKTAFDFLNAEGNYENGIWKKDSFITYLKSGLVHGLKHCLRGIRLFVLKEGEISIGDTVTVFRGKEKVDILDWFFLKKDHERWLEGSVEIALDVEQNEQEKRKQRQSLLEKR